MIMIRRLFYVQRLGAVKQQAITETIVIEVWTKGIFVGSYLHNILI